MLSRLLSQKPLIAKSDEPDSAVRFDVEAKSGQSSSTPQFPRIVPNDLTAESDAATVTDRNRDVTLWLRRTDQLLLGVLLIALLILLILFRWKLAGAGRGEIEISGQMPREYYYAIDINSASWVEWAQLDGIGQKLAKRIVQDREERGPFRSIDDVGRVRGLGSKLVDKLRPFLRCDDSRADSSDSPSITEPR